MTTHVTNCDDEEGEGGSVENIQRALMRPGRPTRQRRGWLAGYRTIAHTPQGENQ